MQKLHSRVVMQRAQVGATEGIAWELLWKLASIKQDLGKPQSLTDMVNEALPAALKGVSRKALSLEGMQPSLKASTELPICSSTNKLCMHHLACLEGA